MVAQVANRYASAPPGQGTSPAGAGAGTSFLTSPSRLAAVKDVQLQSILGELTNISHSLRTSPRRGTAGSALRWSPQRQQFNPC